MKCQEGQRNLTTLLTRFYVMLTRICYKKTNKRKEIKMDKQKEKTKIFKHNSGITLIALVITIIVLLILAGVALATLTGNTSIIDNANNAVERYNQSANEDQNVLNQVKDLFAKYMGGEQSGETGDDDDDDTPPAATEVTLTAGQSASVDASGYATIKTKIVADAEHNIQIVIPTGFAPAILNTTTNATSSAPGEDGSIKNVMPAAQWSNITAAQINSGVVIKNAAGEEFVWVPIPNSSDFARTPWTWTYTPEWDDQEQTITQSLAEATDENKTDKYWEDTTQANTEYQNMITSVNANKGFYISRYEASNDGSSVAQSKRGISPWVNVGQTTAITASSDNSISNTHLMYGIEWDSVLKWIERTTDLSVTDSRNWGNYYNSTGDAATNEGSLRTTTHNEYWKANNIYDLAGNVWEWTQEKYSTGTLRAYRGGVCSSSGDISPAASRYGDSETNADDFDIRFPFQLLLVALGSGSDVA